MRFTGARFEYGVIKLEYVDPDNNSDKFYTVIMDHQDLMWQAHYGRNGTAGTVTAAKADRTGRLGFKKAQEKIDKGYDLVTQGIASFASKPRSTQQITMAPLRERRFI